MKIQDNRIVINLIFFLLNQLNDINPREKYKRNFKAQDIPNPSPILEPISGPKYKERMRIIPQIMGLVILKYLCMK